jgi:flagellar motor switch protein FliM
MPDSQVMQLKRMMQREHHQSYVEVCLSSLCLKKKEIIGLEVGDLLMLNLKQLELDIMEEGIPVAKASYGIRRGEPHIRIGTLKKRAPISYNSNKYEEMKISFGMIEKSLMQEGKMIALSPVGEHDAVLDIEDRSFAKAKLVTVDRKIALQITALLQRSEGRRG